MPALYVPKNNLALLLDASCRDKIPVYTPGASYSQCFGTIPICHYVRLPGMTDDRSVSYGEIIHTTRTHYIIRATPRFSSDRNLTLVFLLYKAAKMTRLSGCLTLVSLFTPLTTLASPIADSPLAARDSDDAYTSIPYYPAPKGGWVSSWSDTYEKAHRVVSNMTLAEKVNLTTGTGVFMGPCSGQTGSALRFGIPNLCFQDSALGVASTDHITYFPAGITVGATFDKELMHSRGVALGEESRGKGVNVQLGPVVGPLGRKPKGGRNWEGFGADPTLQAIGGAQTIKGMQSTGSIACLKHFIANEQEMHRMTSVVTKAYSSNVDDRTMHELYLWPFAEGVRAGVGSIMVAYNDVSRKSLLLTFCY